MKTIIEVGAHTGGDTRKYAQDADWVYAFEPNRDFVNGPLNDLAKDCPNIRVVWAAVSDQSGTSKFNIVPAGSTGASSLLEVRPDVGKVWGGNDYRVVQSYDVPVITLADFVAREKIGSIDFLHIDAQGCDLKVLIGLGEAIGIVKAGVMEMARDANATTYVGQPVLADAEKFLIEHGFKIVSRVKNDHRGNELNIYFQR